MSKFSVLGRVALIPVLVGSFSIVAAQASATAVQSVTPEVASAPAGPFTGVSPQRLLDTRTGAGAGGLKRPLGAKKTITLKVVGAVVPAGSLAVVLNLTVTGPTTAGTITAWNGASPRPSTSNVNFLRGQTVANLAVVPVSSTGTVALYNSGAGSVSVVADVAGYYRPAAAPSAGDLTPVSPRRLLDTRIGLGAPRAAVQRDGTVSLNVTGANVPPGVPSVLLNVTVTQPQSSGFVTVYGSRAARPTSSNLNFVKGQTVPNLVLAPVGENGKVALYNGSAGSVHLVADIFGYFIATVPTTAGALQSLAPARVLDTRHAIGVNHPIAAHQAMRVQISGLGGVPTTGAAAAVLTVTVASPTAGGNVTVYPNGAARPLASNINFPRAGTVPNLVMAKLGVGGAVLIYNDSPRPLSVIADVAGFYLATALATPASSISHYVRDTSVLSSLGAQDAVANGAGSHVVLLDIGAQTVTAPLSTANPGVLLTSTSTRIGYSTLVTALQDYLTAYSANRGTGTATVVVATNSEGDFNAYSAAARGRDWWTRVVSQLSATGVTVIGGNDIEAGFAATATQALDWEKAYLAQSGTAKLVFTGSADACPATHGVTTAACGAVAVDGGAVGQAWTQANYWQLTHGLAATRLVALPQIYLPIQAAQWANIAARGNSADRLSFLGALTERGACPGAEAGCPSASLSPAQGWAALKLALNGYAVTAATVPTCSTDLRVN